jgi:hypothetical protein
MWEVGEQWLRVAGWQHERHYVPLKSKAEEEVEPVLVAVNVLKSNVSEASLASRVLSEILAMWGIPRGCRT